MIPMLVPSLILIAGVVDDLRSRKVHNELVMAAILLAAVYAVLDGGAWGLMTGLGGASTAAAITLPLVLLGALGAGDLKIFIAFGLATSSSVALYVGVSALVWGALLGVIRAALGGEIRTLLANTLSVAGRRTPGQLHRIPYTVPLFMGWLTYLAATGRMM